LLLLLAISSLEARPRHTTIHVTADNDLVSITINGKPISISGALNWWYTVKTFELGPSVKPGDEIAITGANWGPYDYNAGNPAAIIATIIYTNNKGKSTVINTGPQWTCDELAPILSGNNGGNNIWTWNNAGPISQIDGKAQWIWSPLKTESSTCKISIPKEDTE